MAYQRNRVRRGGKKEHDNILDKDDKISSNCLLAAANPVRVNALMINVSRCVRLYVQYISSFLCLCIDPAYHIKLQLWCVIVTVRATILFNREICIPFSIRELHVIAELSRERWIYFVEKILQFFFFFFFCSLWNKIYWQFNFVNLILISARFDGQDTQIEKMIHRDTNLSRVQFVRDESSLSCNMTLHEKFDSLASTVCRFVRNLSSLTWLR